MKAPGSGRYATHAGRRPRAIGAPGVLAATVGLLALGVSALGAPQRSAAAPGAAGQSSAATHEARGVRDHVKFLAADALEGRLTGSAGAAIAADYLATQLQTLGAQPLPGAGDYRLPFEFTSGIDDAGSSLAIAGSEWLADSGAVQALSFSDNGEVRGDLVFAGYGLAIPDSQGFPYDSYATLDVEGKIVVVLRYFPEDVDQPTRAILSRYSGLRYKALQARERGAVGIIVVTGPRSPNAGELVTVEFDTAAADSGIVGASVNGDVALRLFGGAGRDLDQVQADLDTGNPHVTGFALGGGATLNAAVARHTGIGHNVVGYLGASAEPAADRPWVVLGAHYDHLGRGRGGNSLARQAEIGEIHNGADDNASGVAAVLAAGERLASMERGRNVVLAFWSGEELGTIGSIEFLRSGVLAAGEIAAYLNFDMVGRASDNKLIVQAVGSSAAWPGLIERSNVPVGFDLKLDDNPYLPTDSSPFHQASVPTLAFFTDVHTDYHRPSDDADRLNYEDLERVARLGALVAYRVAGQDSPPPFAAVAPPTGAQGSRDTVRAFTGTIPDYASDIEGLLLGGVIEGGPAEEAGLRAGDVIVEFGGQKIANIYDYTFALDAVKVGVTIDVVYVRDGERHETKLTPRARR